MIFQDADIDTVSAIIARCARDLVMPRFRALSSHDIKTKTAPDDLVTQADLDMESALEEALTTAFPGTLFLGEEGVSAGKVSLDILADPQARVWVVDPIDGTYNFVHGNEKFGTLVAFVHGGTTLAGWIYDAPRGIATTARKGGGVTRNGTRFGLSTVQKATDAMASVNLRYFPDALHPGLTAGLETVREQISLRCAAHEYLDFLEGKIDFSLHNRANPWDHMAGKLAVEELGGVVQTWSGASYDPSRPNHLLIAANQALWEDVRETILKDLP